MPQYRIRTEVRPLGAIGRFEWVESFWYSKDAEEAGKHEFDFRHNMPHPQETRGRIIEQYGVIEQCKSN
jgi:hypothetical protein